MRPRNRIVEQNLVYDFFRSPAPLDFTFTPPVTILKAVKGLDAQAYENFVSFCDQEYPEFEVLFGVADADDPVIPVIEQLRRAFPHRHIQHVVVPVCGANRKASILHYLVPIRITGILLGMNTETPPKRSRARTPNNKTTTGFRISDDLWAVLEPLLPVRANTHRFGGGRPRVPDRRCADAIFFVLRTGAHWEALNETELCRKSTAHDRFREWVEAGVFLTLWQAGVEHFDESKGIDWNWLSMDGAMTKAPLAGEKTGPNPTDRGQKGAKRSLLVEASGVPIGLTIDGANRNDMKLVRATIESMVAVRPAPRDEQPQGMCLDKGYDYAEVRDILHEFGFTAHIRARGEEAKELAREAGHKARRWVVERTHSWMNRFRRILVRWEKKPEHYLAFLHFACALIAFRAAGLFG